MDSVNNYSSFLALQELSTQKNQEMTALNQKLSNIQQTTAFVRQARSDLVNLSGMRDRLAEFNAANGGFWKRYSESRSMQMGVRLLGVIIIVIGVAYWYGIFRFRASLPKFPNLFPVHLDPTILRLKWALFCLVTSLAMPIGVMTMLAPGLIVHPRGIIPDAPREEDVTRLEASLMDRLHIDEKTLALLVERARNRQLTEQDLIDSVEHLQERISQSTQENS